MRILRELFARTGKPEIASMTVRELTPQERGSHYHSPGWYRLVTTYADGTTREGPYILTVPHTMAMAAVR